MTIIHYARGETAARRSKRVLVARRGMPRAVPGNRRHVVASWQDTRHIRRRWAWRWSLHTEILLLALHVMTTVNGETVQRVGYRRVDRWDGLRT